MQYEIRSKDNGEVVAIFSSYEEAVKRLEIIKYNSRVYGLADEEVIYEYEIVCN